MLLKTKVNAKFVHQLVVEFLPIISDDVSGYTIPEDDIPFDEVHNSFFLHFMKYSSFSPLRETICHSQDYECPSEDFGVNGPTTSNPQASNGHEAIVGCRGSRG